MSDLNIRREESGNKGRWFVELDGDVAEMTYSRASAQLIIVDHTDVPEAFKGKGVGAALAKTAIETARKEGFKIMPLCPFLRAQFERRPEWSDVRRG
jgi:predicted GNAT family acetyltransferase